MSGLSGTAMSAGWLTAGVGAYGAVTVVGLVGEVLALIALLGGDQKRTSHRFIRRLAFGLLSAAFVYNAVMIGSMWVELGRPPFKTLYETLLLYPLCIALVSIILVTMHRLWPLVPFAGIGALACLVYARAKPDLELVLMPPALQSAWFVPHVVTYFIAYAGLFVSFALACLALFFSFFKTEGARKALAAEMPLPPKSWLALRGGISETPKALAAEMPLPLEEAAHKAVMIGFAALTLGLAMGAAWGKSAWGDYWQWDPKENWAFITWLAYLSYIHLRLIGAWRGKRALWINLACFAAVMFTYLGMHLLPAASGSLHVYQ
ncbi:MAG: cytochrome c biogenesis protein CcsA [Planctomycetota bacterium]|nr:cytochrome c biogenesis protein CcsA [Planctomycetota bacterium]